MRNWNISLSEPLKNHSHQDRGIFLKYQKIGLESEWIDPPRYIGLSRDQIVQDKHGSDRPFRCLLYLCCCCILRENLIELA